LKKLDGYIAREMIVPFLIGTVAVVLMFQANTYIALAKSLNLDNVPKAAVFQYIYFQTPFYLNMTLAVGTSLGSSLAMSRIARESELTAIRAAGVPILRTIAPILCFGLLIAIGNFYMAEKIMPDYSQKANNVGAKIGIVATMYNLKTNASVTLQGYTASFGSVTRKGEQALTFENVWLFRQPKKGEETVYFAESGEYSDGLWTFNNPKVIRLVGLDQVSPARGTKLVINQRMFTEGMFTAPPTEEKTAEELRKSIEFGRRSHQDTKGMEVKLQERYSVPAACIVFALVGPVFAIIFARSGGFVGVFLSIIMVLLYYNAFVISTEILSKLDFVSSWMAAWLPNILFLVLGVVGIRRLE